MGRKSRLHRPHAARGPRVWDPCTKVYLTRMHFTKIKQHLWKWTQFTCISAKNSNNKKYKRIQQSMLTSNMLCDRLAESMKPVWVKSTDIRSLSITSISRVFDFQHHWSLITFTTQRMSQHCRFHPQPLWWLVFYWLLDSDEATQLL